MNKMSVLISSSLVWGVLLSGSTWGMPGRNEEKTTSVHEDESGVSTPLLNSKTLGKAFNEFDKEASFFEMRPSSTVIDIEKQNTHPLPSTSSVQSIPRYSVSNGDIYTEIAKTKAHAVKTKVQTESDYATIEEYSSSSQESGFGTGGDRAAFKETGPTRSENVLDLINNIPPNMTLICDQSMGQNLKEFLRKNPGLKKCILNTYRAGTLNSMLEDEGDLTGFETVKSMVWQENTTIKRVGELEGEKGQLTEQLRQLQHTKAEQEIALRNLQKELTTEQNAYKGTQIQLQKTQSWCSSTSFKKIATGATIGLGTGVVIGSVAITYVPGLAEYLGLLPANTAVSQERYDQCIAENGMLNTSYTEATALMQQAASTFTPLLNLIQNYVGQGAYEDAGALLERLGNFSHT